MRRGWRRVVAVVVAGGLAVGAPGAAAGEPAPPSTTTTTFHEAETLPELQQHLDEAVAEEAALLLAYRQATERRAELDQQVVDLTTELRATTRRLEDAQHRYDQAYAAYVNAELRVDEVTARLVAARDRLRRQAVAAYAGGGEEDVSLALLMAEDAAEMSSGMVYAEAIVAHQHDLVQQVEGLREEVDALALDADRAREEAEGHRDEVAERRASLEAARQHLVDAQAQARMEEARQQDLLEQVREKRSEYEQRIAALQAENARIAALLQEYQAALERQRAAEEAAANADPPLVERPDVPLLWPLPGATVTSGYGYRIHPIYGTRRLHTGLDMGGQMGAEILAAADGAVVLAGVNGGYGNCVVIYHGDGMSTLYGHQSRIGVAVGDVVRRGDVIGYVGSTGVSTGPHLHFEVRINGNPVDPVPYL
ncbi:MAG TPA: peptidoglycan DD-metalloendopeptidase family protein [Acidimicrobiales bacterium]